jgi:hypothetical protein
MTDIAAPGLVKGGLDFAFAAEVNTAGDGFLATFDGPGRAIRCAVSICREVLHSDALHLAALDLTLTTVKSSPDVDP